MADSLESPFAGIDVSDLVKQSQRPTLRDMYESVADGNPDQAAKVMRISSQTGQPPSFVTNNLAESEKAAAVPSDSIFNDIEKHHPVAARFLSDPRHMAVAHDDIGNVAAHEYLTNDVRSAKTILDALEAGFQGSSAGLALRGKLPTTALDAKASITQRLAAQVGGLAGDFPAMVAGGFAGGLAGGPAAPFTAGAGAFALPAAIKESLTQHYENGNIKSAHELLDRTYKVAKESLKQGTIGALTAGAGVLAKSLGAVAAAGAEVATMTTASAAVEGRLPKPMDFAETAIMVGGMHGAGKIADLAHSRWVESKKIEAEQNFYRAMGQTAEASKLRARLPEQHQQLIKELTNGTQVDSVHVPVEAWERYFQGANIDPANAAKDLGVEKAYAEAKATGESVKVPMDTWVNNLVGTKHYDGLAGDIKFDPEGLTPNQIQERNAAIKEQVAAEQEKSQQAIAADAELKKGHDFILDDVTKQLKDAGYLEGYKNRDQVIESQAKVAAAHYTTEAIRRGVDVAQLYKSEAPRILGAEGSQAGPESMAQAEPTGPGPEGAPDAGQQPDEHALFAPSQGSRERLRTSETLSSESPSEDSIRAIAQKFNGYADKNSAMADFDQLTPGITEQQVKDMALDRAKEWAKVDLASMSQRERMKFNDLLVREALLLHHLGASSPELLSKIKEVEDSGKLFQPSLDITETPEFKEWFRDSKVLDQEGRPKVVYHGTKRPDRVGTRFKKSRATSGPMAFFTDDPDIGSNYAQSKADTSRLNEDEGGDYNTWFKFKPKGSRSMVNIDRAWWHLSDEQRQKIAERAPQITRTDDADGKIVAEPGNTRGLGGYDQHLKEAHGNHLKALVEEWLSSGSLYGTEEDFAQVLDLAGMKGAVWDSPHKEQPAVFPVHLSIQNPLDTGAVTPEIIDALQKRANRQRSVPPDQQGADTWDKSRRDPQEWVSTLKDDMQNGRNSHVWTSIPDWVTDTLKSLGYDGIHDTGGKLGGQEHTVWIPFDESQVKSAIGNSGAFDPSNPDILKQGDRGFFDAQQKVISLLKTADPSTFMHESAHAWLDSTFNYVKSGQADAEYLKHWDAARKWLDVKDEQESLTREQQEKFAKAFEDYLHEGRAPTEGLTGIFAQFRRWMTQIYRRARGEDIPGEMRGFMDRMVATDDEIARAGQAVGYQPSEIAELPDVTPETRTRIRTLQERARQLAENTLLKEQMAELGDENKAALDKERERLRGEIDPQVREMPLYRAMEDVEENRPGARRSAASLAQDFMGKKLSDQETAAFETAAEVHGFSDGTDLAQSILADAEAGGLEGTIKARVEKAMLPFANLKDTDAIRQRALEAIHSERSGELLALEQQTLAELAQKQEIGQEITKRRRVEASLAADAAKQQAKALLESKPLKEAGAFRQYVTAERNAAVRVSKALADGDYAKAAEAKQQQMLNHALASEALKNRSEITRKMRFLDKYAERGGDLMNMPYGFVSQIDNLLANNGLRDARDPEQQQNLLKIAMQMDKERASPLDIANSTGYVKSAEGSWQREGLRDFVARVNDNYRGLQLPDSVMNADAGPLRQGPPDLTLAQLRDLNESVKSIAMIGRTFERFLSDFLKGDLRTAAADLRASIEKNIGKPYGDVPALGTVEMGKVAEAVDKIRAIPDGMISTKVNLLTLTEYLDRLDPDGPAKNYIYRPLERSWNDERKMRSEKADELNAIRERYYSKDDLSKWGDTLDSWDVNTDAGPKRVKITRENALVMLLNRGSESNLDRLMNGFGVDEARIRQITDKLSENDHKFAQDTWDFVDKFWPEASRLEMDVKGVEPVKVHSRPVESAHGTFRGGYYPLAYDFDKSSDAYRNSLDRNALFKEYTTTAAHTEQGFMQSRVSSLERPVRLDFSGLYNHLDDVIHDITHRKAVIDVARFVNQPDAKNAIINAIGQDGYRKINEDLKHVASTQAEFLTPNEQTVKWFRFATTFATLGYRAVIFPRRMVEDVANSFREVAPRELLGSIGDTLMDPRTSREFVRSKSVLMSERAVNRERDLIDLSKEWQGKDSMVKHFAFMQDTIADQAMSYPVWNAVYKGNLERYGEQRAVELADESIVKTFGSGRELDKVGAQRGGELNRIMSMYYSWHSMMFNRAWLQGKIAGLDYKEGNVGAALATMAKMTAMTWVLPAANEILWGELFHNSQQQASGEDRKKRMLSKVLEAPFAYFPMARNVAAYAVPEILGEKGRNYRLSPLEDAAENVIKTAAHGANIAGTKLGLLEGKDFDQRFMEDAARSAAVLIGYPQTLNTWVFNFADWLNKEGEANWRDLLTRRTKR